MKRSANPLKIDLDKLPPSMRPKDYVQTPGTGPKQIVETPLRTLLAQRANNGDHVPTAETREGVMHAIAFGIEPEIVAKIAGISAEQLHQLYADEIVIGRPLLMNDLQTNLYNIGSDKWHKDSVRASMWLLERLGGDLYRPANRFELSGPNGRAIQVDQRTQTIDPSLLSVDQRDALREILTSAMKLAQAVPSTDAQPVIQPAIEGRFEQVQGVEDLLA